MRFFSGHDNAGRTRASFRTICPLPPFASHVLTENRASSTGEGKGPAARSIYAMCSPSGDQVAGKIWLTRKSYPFGSLAATILWAFLSDFLLVNYAPHRTPPEWSRADFGYRFRHSAHPAHSERFRGLWEFYSVAEMRSVSAIYARLRNARRIKGPL